MDSLKNLSKAPRSPKKYIYDIVREKIIRFKREKPSLGYLYLYRIPIGAKRLQSNVEGHMK